MLRYAIERLVQTVPVLLGVTALSFGLMFLSGDPTMLMAGEDWTQEQVQEFRHTMGFDRPVYIQYFDFLGKAVRGDFGTSLRQKQPTFQLVMEPYAGDDRIDPGRYVHRGNGWYPHWHSRCNPAQYHLGWAGNDDSPPGPVNSCLLARFGVGSGVRGTPGLVSRGRSRYERLTLCYLR